MFLLVGSLSTVIAKSEEEASNCLTKVESRCHDRAKAQSLNNIAILAILAILAASMVGVSLPLFSRSVPALHPDKDLFLLVRAFASGVIVATGFMHVMPDSWNDLTSPCLPEKPWKALSRRQNDNVDGNKNGDDVDDKVELGLGDNTNVVHGHHHGQIVQVMMDCESSKLLKDRVVAQVLELGIVVHSVVIGLSMGSSDNPCTIRPLVAAICFHQLFEGMGLGGCILQENSPIALIVVGILNAVSAGLLIYMALVDLLASDFKGPKLQGNLKLQLFCYVAALLGTGLMSSMAIWA
uniref:Uncharacterized protein n=1 Tax=Chenopodium quinoa TaxID=63459 RepID=A0A803LZY7_CHEQI